MTSLELRKEELGYCSIVTVWCRDHHRNLELLEQLFQQLRGVPLGTIELPYRVPPPAWPILVQAPDKTLAVFPERVLVGV